MQSPRVFGSLAVLRKDGKAVHLKYGWSRVRTVLRGYKSELWRKWSWKERGDKVLIGCSRDSTVTYWNNTVNFKRVTSDWELTRYSDTCNQLAETAESQLQFYKWVNLVLKCNTTIMIFWFYGTCRVLFFFNYWRSKVHACNAILLFYVSLILPAHCLFGRKKSISKIFSLHRKPANPHYRCNSLVTSAEII